MKHHLRVVCVLLSIMLTFPTLARAQELETENVFSYSVVRNPVSGEFELVPSIRSLAQGNATDSLKAKELGVAMGQYLAEGEAFVALDKFGEVSGVYPVSDNGEAFTALFEELDAGGKIVKANWFGEMRRRSPTVDEAREITQAAMNQMLTMVCDSDMRPEVMTMDVEISVSLGVTGKFAFQSEWRPSRDCDN